MTDAPERSLLESKSRDELVAIADAAGVKLTARARKAAIVDAILGDPPADKAPEPDAVSEPPGDDAPSVKAEPTPATDSREGSGPKVRRVRRAAGAQDADAAEETSGSTSDAPEAQAEAGARTRNTGEGKEANDKSQTKSEGDRSSNQGGSNRGGNNQGDSDQGGAGQGGDAGVAEPGNRRRRRRGRDRDRDDQWQGDPVECEGVLDLRDEGYGFLRTKGVLASNDDVYVAAKQVRQFDLRRGDRVKGTARPAARNEKNPALIQVEEINGAGPKASKDRPDFDDLTPLFPDERLQLERAEQPWNLTPRIIDLLAPIGKGQRGLIVSPPKAGKTTIMKEIAKSIEVNNPDVHLIVLLVDERPEEVTDMRRSISGEVMASTFDRPVDEHIAVAELTLERAKRMVESGRDVVIVLDGITRLARAYNLAAPGTGRMMSGGVDAGALYPPKKFFGTARNLEEGGSLTILATALVETGSRMDEVIFEEFKGTGNMELRLDRRMAERQVFPAIHVDGSSTRREELLMDRKRVDQVRKLRKVLQGLSSDAEGPGGAGLELLVERLSNFKSNDEFLDEIGRAKS